MPWLDAERSQALSQPVADFETQPGHQKGNTRWGGSWTNNVPAVGLFGHLFDCSLARLVADTIVPRQNYRNVFCVGTPGFWSLNGFTLSH
jgi:hypothetical protein